MTGKEMYDLAADFMTMRLYYIDEDEDDTDCYEIYPYRVNIDWNNHNYVVLDFIDVDGEWRDDRTVEITISNQGEFVGLYKLGDNLFLDKQEAIDVIKHRLQKRLKQLG